MTITAKYGQTIFDIALIAYQDASRAYDLIAGNPQIENINSDLTGITITYVPSTITDKEAIKTPVTTQKNVAILSTQTAFDIALQYYGSADKVYDFILENGIESILSDLTGKTLKYTQNNTYVPLYFRTTGGNIATKPVQGTSLAQTYYRILESGEIRITESNDKRILE